MASSAKEKKYRGARQKRMPVMAPEFDENGNQTKASMMYGRIDPAYLTRLIMEYKAVMDPFVAERKEVAKTDKEKAAKMVPPQMSEELGLCVDIIIKKTLGLQRWREYTPAWHEEMYAHALMLILRYLHNFDPTTIIIDEKTGKEKHPDPYFYVGQIAWNACNQVWNVLTKQSQRVKFIPLVDGIYHSVTAMDQYAGVLEKEEKLKAEKLKADLVNENITDIDDTIDQLKEIDASVGIRLEDEWIAQLNAKKPEKVSADGDNGAESKKKRGRKSEK